MKLSLQLDRPGTLSVELPETQQLVRAKVNGLPVATTIESRRLTLEVAPTSLGATEAVVELATTQALGVFHLSGELTLESPKLSWPVAHWTTQTVLPKVFTYERHGGSMEQMGGESVAEGDVPGKSLFFSQHLITASAPVVSLGYSVELTNRYFR